VVLAFSHFFFNYLLYNKEMENVCEICGGSGQIGQFLGVSRFVITWDECPECCGTGICHPSEKQTPQDETPPTPLASKENKQTPDR